MSTIFGHQVMIQIHRQRIISTSQTRQLSRRSVLEAHIRNARMHPEIKSAIPEIVGVPVRSFITRFNFLQRLAQFHPCPFRRRQCWRQNCCGEFSLLFLHTKSEAKLTVRSGLVMPIGSAIGSATKSPLRLSPFPVKVLSMPKS